jgi:DNA polymerase-3 subunit epsilon
MRQIVLDTETTGLAAELGHRLIEIACIELVNRRPSGRQFHRYLNPERDIDAGASAVHGITRERLAQAPKFAEVAEELFSFIRDSELIIHNAPFDLGFIDAELTRLAGMSGAGAGTGPGAALPAGVRSVCTVLDTLTLARARHPGQRNSLDALCKRYGIDNSQRDLHGALLDARILADVYLAMTGGQSLLALDEAARASGGESDDGVAVSVRPAGPLTVINASEEELAAHAQLAALLHKASGGACLWTALESGGARVGETPSTAATPTAAPPTAGLQ